MVHKHLVPNFFCWYNFQHNYFSFTLIYKVSRQHRTGQISVKVKISEPQIPVPNFVWR